jgi:hypothetical protein
MSTNEEPSSRQAWPTTPAGITIITMDLHISRFHYRPPGIKWKQEYNGSSGLIQENGSFYTNGKKRIGSSGKITH